VLFPATPEEPILQLSLGANVLKEHDQLELEEDNRINRRTTEGRVTVAYQITDKAQVQRALDVAVEMVSRNEIL
jgi:hypothetical protein